MKHYSMAMQGKHGAQNAIGYATSYAAQGIGLTYDPWTDGFVAEAVPFEPSRLITPDTRVVRGMGRRGGRRRASAAVARIAAKQKRAALSGAKSLYQRGGRPVLGTSQGGVRTGKCAVWGKRNCLPGYIATEHAWGFCFCRNPRT